MFDSGQTVGHSSLLSAHAYITLSSIVLVIMLFGDPVENKCFYLEVQRMERIGIECCILCSHVTVNNNFLHI